MTQYTIPAKSTLQVLSSTSIKDSSDFWLILGFSANGFGITHKWGARVQKQFNVGETRESVAPIVLELTEWTTEDGEIRTAWKAV